VLFDRWQPKPEALAYGARSSLTPGVRLSKEVALNYFALIYDLVDDMVNRRVPYRDAHLGLAREAHARGDLLLAGAFSNPPDRALLVFRASDTGPVEEFVRKDPYVINGLVKRWEVRPWTVVVGNE
jgi:hypothetical protein